MIWPCHFRASGSDGLKVISGPGLIDISEPEALMASMQLRGPDGLHYSYSYRVRGSDDLDGT